MNNGNSVVVWINQLAKHSLAVIIVDAVAFSLLQSSPRRSESETCLNSCTFFFWLHNFCAPSIKDRPTVESYHMPLTLVTMYNGIKTFPL